jgi:hypothetical protein
VSVSTILWRRLDTEGHDVCRLIQQESGWRLEGTAVFLQESERACLAYELHCDQAWQTRDALVQGWMGARSLDFHFARLADDLWTLNGQVASQVKGCVDLDLGFTPATNLSQIRRIALRVGEAADVPVAWFDVSTGTLETLHQRYERRTADTYWYESRRFSYSALLHVNAAGFVEKYPELWEAIP